MSSNNLFVTKKELLKEIHKSKNTFSSYKSLEYADYDIILDDLASLTPSIIDNASIKKAEKLKCSIDNINEIIIRVMTFEHIPLDPDRKKIPKTVAEHHAKVNFPPYKHYAYENGVIEEVGKSHWKGDYLTGNFSIDHGKITNRLAMYFGLMAEKLRHKGRWQSYTYGDEMIGSAILQLCQVGLQFNESKSDNPFAYYTTVISHAFMRIDNLERRQRDIRDDILIANGEMPSFTRQINDEITSKQEMGHVEYQSMYVNNNQTSNKKTGPRKSGPKPKSSHITSDRIPTIDDY